MLSAYRLPDNLFANAKITVDIVFLQKSITNIAWQKTQNINIGNHNKPITEYFIKNPDNVLGELDIVKMYQRMGITCNSSGILHEKLRVIFASIPKLSIFS